MQVKDKGLVLQSIKYADKKNIIRLFTREHGVVTCMARISKSNNSKIKPATLMNMNLVDIEFIHKQNKDIQVLTEANCLHIYSSIHKDIHKLSILQFINEVLSKTVKEQGPQAELFDFVFRSLVQLDLMSEAVTNFHHYFLIELLKHFGFEPVNNFDAEEKYFDCREGRFSGVEFPGPIGLNAHSSELLSKALNTDILHQKLNNAQRADLLESLLSYYRFHIPGFNELKCLDVLKEIANA
jgi:DNA repair protein RecO (recombination protein O)